MNKRVLGFFSVWIIALPAHAYVSLSNVSAFQREGTKLVDIYYDAFNDDGLSISASIVISNGASQVSASSFSGNIGSSTSEGSGLHVVWDGGADLNNTHATNLSITVSISEPVPFSMVPIPAGTNSGSDPDFGSYNLMVSAFYMDTTEITKSDWDVVANQTSGITANDGSGKAPSHPVQYVTWYECARWCNGRSTVEGLTPCYNLSTWSCNSNANGYRLPTEDEWEYAARGGLSSLRYPWGNSIDHTNANYDDSMDGYHPDYFTGGRPYTSPVGSFDSNGYGLYDMAGNVAEWCDDIAGTGRKLKGGSWDWSENDARIAPHWALDRTTFRNDVGFRTVRNAPDPEAETVVLEFDSRDYQLEVSSDHGSPVPGVGVLAYAWKSAVTCSVDAVVNEGGTNYTCVGWTGTGSVPMSGSSNGVVVVLTNLESTISWNWATDDTDSDGMDDDWEIAYFGDLDQAATNDFDFDGQADLFEYIAGTNPTNKESLFQILDPGFVPGTGFILHWPAASNRIYSVDWTDNLIYTPFTNLESDIAFPRNSATDTLHSAGSQGYYRIDVRK